MGKRRMRKRYEGSFKARVALADLKDDKTLSELASEFGVLGNLISQWKRRLLSNVPRVFEEPEDEARQDHKAVVEALHRQIGQLHVELAWLKKKLPSSPAERRHWVTPGDRRLSIAQQCQLLDLPRSTYYHSGAGETDWNLKLMRLIDE